MANECGCGPDFRKPKDNGTCASCGGWLPGKGPGKDQPSLVALINGDADAKS